MGTLTNFPLLFVTLISVRLTICDANLKTINFVFNEASEEQISKYSSLRELPFLENRFRGIPFYLLLKSLAAKLNVSNIVTQNWFNPEVLENLRSKSAQDDNSNEVTILALASAFSYNPNSLKYQWDRFNDSRLKPIPFMVNNFIYNFVYCDMPNWQKQPVWSMQQFTKVLDKRTWICMAITTLLIVTVLGRERFGTHFFLIISSILCSGLSGTLRKRHLIFVAWILPIRTLVDMYSSQVSSRLISPPAERTLKSFADVDRNNYSAAVEGDNIAPVLLIFFSFMRSNQTGSWITQGFVHISNIYERNVVGSPGFLDPFEMAQFLVQNYSSKVLYTNLWIFPMLMLNVIEAARDNEVKNFENGALCHLGEEPLNAGANFWVFLPPNHERLAMYFQRTIDSGLFFRLQDEHIGFSHSLRVQDRNRVISKTQLKTSTNGDRMKHVLNHQFQAKMSKVFFLWTVCILLCCTVMEFELAISFVRRTKVKDYNGVVTRVKIN